MRPCGLARPVLEHAARGDGGGIVVAAQQQYLTSHIAYSESRLELHEQGLQVVTIQQRL